MNRSNRKGPFIRSSNKNIFSKSSVITKYLINTKVTVYNGKVLNEVVINKNMVGYNLGEFVNTKTKFSFKKLQINQNFKLICLLTIQYNYL